MDGMPNNAGPYAEVFRKIGYYRANSVDSSFHAYLDKKLEEAEKGLVTPQDLIAELDMNYSRYQEYAKSLQNNSNNVQTPVVVAPVVQQESEEAKEEKKKRRSELEYKIGTGLLSVIGGVFVLVALVYFGKYFLEDIYQGVLLFAGGSLVVILSELILERKLPVLGHIITGIGFGILYFATIFSYTKLNMYNIYIAFIIVFAISVINAVLAKGRKSQIMEIICSIGAASSILVATGDIKTEDFLIVAAVILFVNLLLFIAPYKKGYTTSKIIRLFVVAITALYFMLPYGTKVVEDVYISGYVVLAIFVMLVAFILNTEEMAIKASALSLIGIVIAERLGNIYNRLSLDLNGFVFMVGLFAVCLISFLVLIKKSEKWAALAVFMLSATSYFALCGNEDVAVLAVLIILVLSKLTLNVKELTVIDAIITGVAYGVAIYYHTNPLSYAILGVGIIGTIMCTKLKLYNEFMLLFVCTVFAAVSAQGFYLVPVVIAVVFALMLLFNLIPTMQVEGTLAYNIVSLVIIGLLVLYAPVQQLKGWENIVCMCLVLVLGMAVILTCFTKKFKLNTNARYIILAVFLTYIAAFMDIGDLWVSISLMAVAFLMIAIGCIANRFEIRIYGLILSLLVCVKVAFYDFDNQDEFSKMIVFFVVGVLAITISFVYMILEKHEQKQLREAEAKKNEIAIEDTQPVVEDDIPENCAPVEPVIYNSDENTSDNDDNINSTPFSSTETEEKEDVTDEGDSKCEEE